MSIEFEARAEAEKRYPVIPDAPFGDSASVSVKRKAFVAGYIAGATRPVTDALSKVTRVTVVSKDGLEFEKYDLFDGGVELHLQDDGRTLKIFPAN